MIGLHIAEVALAAWSRMSGDPEELVDALASNALNFRCC